MLNVMFFFFFSFFSSFLVDDVFRLAPVRVWKPYKSTIALARRAIEPQHDKRIELKAMMENAMYVYVCISFAPTEYARLLYSMFNRSTCSMLFTVHLFSVPVHVFGVLLPTTLPQ